MRYQLLLSMLLLGSSFLGSSALQAAEFSFTYSGTNVYATGTLTAMSEGGGLYEITNITGERNGDTIVESPLGNLGVNYTGTGGVLGLESGGAIEFGLQNVIGLDTVEYVGGIYEEVLASTDPSITKLTTFAVTAVPEPSTLLIFLTLGLAVWALSRKLPLRKLRKQ